MAVTFKSIYGDTSKETLRGLHNQFKNTPLEPYLKYVVEFFFGDWVKKFEEGLLDETRQEIRQYIDEMIDLGMLLRDLKNGVLKGTGWQVHNKSDILHVYDSVESLFLDRLDELPDIIHRFEWEDFSPITTDEWEKALKIFPGNYCFEKEDVETDEDGNEVEYGDRRLSINEIEYAIKDLKQCRKIAKQFYLEMDNALVNRFVEFMISKGVPQTRAIYRCLYSALESFNGIPTEVKKSHKTTISTNDPQSNYIKAIVSRLKKKP